MKRPIQIVLMPLFCLLGEAAFFSPASAQKLDSADVAIFKITYEGLMPKSLGEIDSSEVDSMLHAQFRNEAEKRQMILMNEQGTASALDEAYKTLQNDSAYFEALAKLNLQYAFVVDFEQLGRFAQILFRRFDAGQKEPFVYPVGTTLDSLTVHTQKAIQELFRVIPSKPLPIPPPQKEKFPWPSIIAAGGGSVILITAAFLIRKPQSTIEVLPGPPKPKKP